MSRVKLVLGVLTGMVLLGSCTSGGKETVAPDSYLLEAELPSLAGQTVLLQQIRFNRPLQRMLVLLDSATIGEDGTLFLEGKLSETILAEVRIGEKPLPLILEPGQRYTLVDDGELLRLSGTPGADRLRQLEAGWTDAYTELSRLGAQMDAYVERGLDRAADSVQILLDQRSEQYWNSIRQLADTTRVPLLGYYAVESLDWPSNFEQIRSFSNRMIGVYAHSTYAKDLQDKIVQWESKLQAQAAEAGLMGKMAPDLSGVTPDGRTVRLSDLRGKVVLVDFWASWCAPCRRENPNVLKQYRRFSNRGFTVFSVSLDKDADAWKKAIAADTLSWPYHIREADFGGPMSSAYGVNAIPAGFLVNPEGLVEAQGLELRGENLVRRLEMLLGP